MEKAIMNVKFIIYTILLISILFSIPFVMHVVGDAQVHLAAAEGFAVGQPFQYNKGDELVSASTSPLWTIFLTLFFIISKHYAPLLLKIIVIIIWGVASFLVYKISSEDWKFPKLILYCLFGIWMTNTAIVANSLSGMENILSCLQLLLLYILSYRNLKVLTWPQAIVMGALLGTMFLTRLDGALFGLMIISLFFIIKLFTNSKDIKYGRIILLNQMVVMVFSCFLIILPWYVYQYLLTSSVITDSSFARMYAGRRNSFEIIEGSLYYHPKALITLATVFFPLFIGFFITFAKLLSRVHYIFSHKVSQIYNELVAIALVLTGLVFYSFIVGADHFGRYFLPIFPFFFFCGFYGLQILYHYLHARNNLASKLLLVITMLFLVLGSSLDYYRRVFKDIYFNKNLLKIVASPSIRKERTDCLLQKLGVPDADSVRLAFTEVQLRYYIDNRIKILSLDGRSSPKILNYIDKNTGVPDFEQYFYDEKPDFVELGQWCANGGWLEKIFPRAIEDNLICDWTNRVNEMKLEESFNWNGRTVIYACPHIVRILW